MNYKRIGYLLLLIILVIIFEAFSFSKDYPDARQYVIMLENLMNGTEVFVQAPFSSRWLMILIAYPLTISFDAMTALSVISGIFTIATAIVLFYIAKEYTERDEIAFLTVCALLTVPSTLLVNYGATALTDFTGMMFVSIIILLVIRNSDSKYILLTAMIGILARETVIFGLLFYLLYTKDKKAILFIVIIIFELLLLRIGIIGSIEQPLGIHAIQDHVGLHLFLTLIIPVCCSCLSLFQHNKTKENKLFIIGILAFTPYVLLGIFNAYFDGRFVMYVLIALIGYVAKGLEVVMKNIHNT